MDPRLRGDDTGGRRMTKVNALKYSKHDQKAKILYNLPYPGTQIPLHQKNTTRKKVNHSAIKLFPRIFSPVDSSRRSTAQDLFLPAPSPARPRLHLFPLPCPRSDPIPRIAENRI